MVYVAFTIGAGLRWWKSYLPLASNDTLLSRVKGNFECVKGYIFDTKYILSLVRTFDCLASASLSDAAGSGRVFLELGI